MVAAITNLIRFTVKITYRLHEEDLWFQFVPNFEVFFFNYNIFAFLSVSSPHGDI